MRRHINLGILAAIAAAALMWPNIPAHVHAAITTNVYLPLVVSPKTVANRAFEQEVQRLINVERAKHGLPALVENSELTLAARRHSLDMSEHNFVGHTGSDGSDPETRAYEEGYTGDYVGEIAAGAFPTPQGVVDAWMTSDKGHPAVILSLRATEFGVGYEKAWTVVFGTR